MQFLSRNRKKQGAKADQWSIPIQIRPRTGRQCNQDGGLPGRWQSLSIARSRRHRSEKENRTNGYALAGGDGENRNKDPASRPEGRPSQSAGRPVQGASSKQTAYPSPIRPGFFIDQCGDIAVYGNLTTI